MNEQFVKDITKAVQKTPIDQELPAGATPRRYEPECGVQKHNERIHKESGVVDIKGLPFSFRKPPKPIGRTAVVQCNKCGHITGGTTATIGVICKNCGEFSTVSEVTLDR